MIKQWLENYREQKKKKKLLRGIGILASMDDLILIREELRQRNIKEIVSTLTGMDSDFGKEKKRKINFYGSA